MTSSRTERDGFRDRPSGQETPGRQRGLERHTESIMKPNGVQVTHVKETSSRPASGAEFEAFHFENDRLSITVAVSDEEFLSLVCNGVLSVSDEGWSRISNPTMLVEDVVVTLENLEHACTEVLAASDSFRLRIVDVERSANFEVVACSLRVKRTKVDPLSSLGESIF